MSPPIVISPLLRLTEILRRFPEHVVKAHWQGFWNTLLRLTESLRFVYL